jgi:hypothetical protein
VVWAYILVGVTSVSSSTWKHRFTDAWRFLGWGYSGPSHWVCKLLEYLRCHPITFVAMPQ